MIGLMRELLGIRRLAQSVARRVQIERTDATQKCMTAQTIGMGGSVRSDVPIVQQYGFVSVPPDPSGQKGCEAIELHLNGDAAQAVVIGTVDRRSRPTDYQRGESGLHDDQGQEVRIGRQSIDITTEKPVNVTASVFHAADPVSGWLIDASSTGIELKFGTAATSPSIKLSAGSIVIKSGTGAEVSLVGTALTLKGTTIAAVKV